MTAAKRHRPALLACFFLLPLSLLSLSVSVRTADHPGYSRIVFEGSRGFQFRLQESGRRLEFHLDRRAEVSTGDLDRPRSSLIERVAHENGETGSVFSVTFNTDVKVKRHFVLERPFRVVFDLMPVPGPNQEPTPSAGPDPQEPDLPPADGPGPDAEEPRRPTKDRSKVIETICLDPGHGGSDLGAVGAGDLREKDITLTVAKRLKRIIESRLGLRVLMTREKDAEVSLNSRVSIANNQKADLFVSIHVNSSFRRGARGPETFFVSLKATDQAAYELAQKENESFEEIDRMAPTDDLKMILWNMAQTQYIRESSKLAEYIQNELNVLLNTINRGVKQAPFRVLMRAAMPAVLVEIAFVSNPSEATRLKSEAFLDAAAQSIYDGIAKFIFYQNSRYR